MIIKAKLKDIILLSELPDEKAWIIKYTEMLKDDPDAEISIITQLEKPEYAISEYNRRKYTGEIYIKNLNVTGKVPAVEY